MEPIIVRDVSFNCQHNRILYDPELAYVLCGLCKKKLNPIWVISQFANHETHLRVRLRYLKKLCEKAEKKNRCKCEHCGKMTDIQKK